MRHFIRIHVIPLCCLSTLLSTAHLNAGDKSFFHGMYVLEDEKDQLVIVSLGMKPKPTGQSESNEVLNSIDILVVRSDQTQSLTYKNLQIPVLSTDWHWERRDSGVVIKQMRGKRVEWAAMLDPLTGLHEAKSDSREGQTENRKESIYSRLEPPKRYGELYPARKLITNRSGRLKVELKFINSGISISDDPVATVSCFNGMSPREGNVFIVTSSGAIIAQAANP